MKSKRKMIPEYRFQKRPKSDLFNHLQKYRFVLVSGPHRAGTTIAAAMIANDLDYEFREDVQTQLETLAGSHQIYNRTVFHCPSYCYFIHQLAEIPNLAAVMVIRDVEAIIASEKRIPWAFEPQQLSFYRAKVQPRPNFPIQSPISVVKYRYWHEVQKPIFDEMGNGYEIRYEDLKSHPMWVLPRDRAGWTSNQLEIGKPHGPRVQGRRFPVGIAGEVIEND